MMPLSYLFTVDELVVEEEEGPLLVPAAAVDLVHVAVVDQLRANFSYVSALRTCVTSLLSCINILICALPSPYSV